VLKGSGSDQPAECGINVFDLVFGWLLIASISLTCEQYKPENYGNHAWR